MSVDSEREKPRGLAALLAKVGLAPDRDVDDETDHAAAALREQAEVFQTMTVGDVMTPRADIEAVEISAPFRNGGRGLRGERALEDARVP